MGKDAKIKATEDISNGSEKDEAGNEKAETESTKESPTKENAEGKGEETEPESKDEGLFDIVGPEEELSDTVFKDDTLEENGKAKDSDDTEVQDIKTEESIGTEEEKMLSPDKEELANISVPVEITAPESKEEVSDETVSQAGVDKQDNLEIKSKESEASFVSAQE